MYTSNGARLRVGTMVLALTVLGAAAVASPAFYGVNNSNLVQLDLTAGTQTVIGPVGANALADVDFGGGDLIAMRMGIGDGFPPPPLHQTWQIDPATGAGTLLSDFGWAHYFTSLAYRPADGGFYTVDQNNGNLGRLDPYTGSFNPVSGVPHGLGMYAVDALAFAPDGTLYGTHNETSPLFGYVYDLVRFDLTTGLGSVIGSVDGGVGDYEALRFDPGTGTAYTIERQTGNVSRVDLSTGAGTVIWNGLAPGVSGLAYIPEPSALVLLGLGITTLIRRR